MAGLGHGRIGRALGQRQHLIGAVPAVAVLAVLAVVVLAVAAEEGLGGEVLSGMNSLLEFHEPTLELGRRLGHRDHVGVDLGGVVTAKALAELYVLEKTGNSFHTDNSDTPGDAIGGPSA